MVKSNGVGVFKGATIATVNLPSGTQSLLYVANFGGGRVHVYNSTFHHLSVMDDFFIDPTLPHGYAPFNVQNIGGNIYVALPSRTV